MLFQDKGYEHDAAYLADLRATTVDVIDVKITGESVEAAVEATHVGMRHSRSFWGFTYNIAGIGQPFWAALPRLIPSDSDEKL